MTDRARTNGHSTGNDSSTQLQSIDAATLTPLVRQAADSETVEVTDWQCHQIHGGAGVVSGGVHRLCGTGRNGGEPVSWSLILKVSRPIPHLDDPSDWNYWKREVLAYQSGLLEDLPGGLAAPRCFGVVEHADGTCWIWLEDVSDDLGPKWPLEHYGVVARHLGQFNGAYLVGHSIPTQPWLRKGWPRDRAARAGCGVAQLRSSVGHPLVRRVFPPDVSEGFFHLYTERDALLDALDRLPQAFCHRDAHRRNLFARYGMEGTWQTVAIDWAFVGTVAVGVEIALLVQMSLAFHAVEIEEALALGGTVFAGYLEGLGDTGWHGDPQMVHLAYAAETALRVYDLLGMTLAVLLDERRHAWAEQLLGCSMEEWVARGARRYRILLAMAGEARGLMDSLS